ncbi:MAG: signal peptidase I [Acidobacteriaceae bacterium]|nr:signal peptidase I [Acidobacteriaceae bacterium]MBV9780967.1 signal peptidase I [Acidobacteriaceae bacterium]
MSIDSAQIPTKLPRLALIAAVVAFVFAALCLLAAIEQPVAVLPALLSILAGFGTLRRRIWSAYGFALLQLSQLAVLSFVVLRSNNSSSREILLAAAVSLALCVLFWFAARSLASTGAQRGLVWPWIAAACAFTLPFIFFQAFVIPTGAMEDTLLIGDHILVRVFPRVHPQRGDMVVFHYPIDRRQVFVKRVIGLPSDRIRIVSKTVYRNGSILTEPYAVHKFNSIDPYRDNFPGNLSRIAIPPGLPGLPGAGEMLRNHILNGEILVPPGKYFVLGDNRDNSLDSRYWGFLDASDVIGEPILIYDSEIAVDSTQASKTVGRHRRRWNRIFKPL